MKTSVKFFWPWILGTTLGLTAAVLYLGVPAVGAKGDNAVVYEVDLSQELTPGDVTNLIEFAQAHEGHDIILRPAEGFEVLPGSERRQHDEELAAKEGEEVAQQVQKGLEERLYVSGMEKRSACAAAKAELIEPGRQLLCESTVVSAPAHLPYVRAKSSRQVEDLLENYIYDLLEGVSAEEEGQGFFSHFSNPAALQSLDLGPDGEVALDFNSTIAEQIGHVHPGYASHAMLQQIYRTVFQFRDVSSVRLTLAGSCDAFGDLIGGPCQDISRDLWEQMLYENQENIKFFNLAGDR